MIVERKSIITGQLNLMAIDVDPVKLETWDNTPKNSRPLVQEAFPELNAEEREFILSGITPEEWLEIFP